MYVKTGGLNLSQRFNEASQAVPELGQGIRDPYEVAIDKPHNLPNLRFAKVNLWRFWFLECLGKPSNSP